MREILQDSVQRLLSEQLDAERLRAAEAGHWNAGLWALVEEGGFTQALVREPAGGSGLAWADVYPVVAAAGEHALPLPLPDTLLAAWLLDRAGFAVPAGPMAVADPDAAPPVRLRADGSLAGELALVPWGRAAGHVVLAAEHDGAPQLVLLATAGLPWRHDLNLAREARDALSLDDLRPLAIQPCPDAGTALRQYGALLRCAQMAGAIDRLVAQSVQYAGERVQFGRAIGQFQAVQQQLALLGCAAAAATAAAMHAFEQAGTPGAWWAVAAAKSSISEAAGQAAGIAHAVHGAIGFTYEHQLHFSTRRLWSWRSEFGHHGWWADRLGAVVCGSDEPFWHAVTRGTDQPTDSTVKEIP